MRLAAPCGRSHGASARHGRISRPGAFGASGLGALQAALHQPALWARRFTSWREASPTVHEVHQREEHAVPIRQEEG